MFLQYKNPSRNSTITLIFLALTIAPDFGLKSNIDKLMGIQLQHGVVQMIFEC